MLRRLYNSVIIVTSFLFCSSIFGQSDSLSAQTKKLKNIDFYQYRGTNAISIGLGTSVMNGDLVDPIFEIYSHIGYKRFIVPHLNINFGYHKFNLAYKDILNEGFMSFDLNIETLFLPNKLFSPFAYIGGGVNAANYFTQVDAKLQGGAGLEYIITDNFGIKLYSDYNHVFSDSLDGKIFGAADDIYWRIALGVNYYFGGKSKKRKIEKGQPSIINSNQIIPNN